MAAAAPVNANLIVRYLPAYQNAQGVQTMFLIDGGTDMEYEGVIDGTENVPIYNRQFAGAMQPSMNNFCCIMILWNCTRRSSFHNSYYSIMCYDAIHFMKTDANLIIRLMIS